MWHSWVEIEISALERKKSAKVKAQVDTGVSLTVLPERIAEELGIEPISGVSTGAGEIKVKRGRAWLKLKGKEDAFPVWISGFIDKVLIEVVGWIHDAAGYMIQV